MLRKKDAEHTDAVGEVGSAVDWECVEDGGGTKTHKKEIREAMSVNYVHEG